MKNLFLCILCCGRHDLLEVTLKSFIEKCIDFKDYSVRVVASDDSGDEQLNEKINYILHGYLKTCSKSIQLRIGKNVGQAASYWHCVDIISKHDVNDNDVILLLEEDWEFTEEFRISEMSSALDEKIHNEEIASVTLRCDVDNFHEYPRFGYNLLQHKDYFVVAPSALSHYAIVRGQCPHNEIICFHPHLIKWNKMKNYSKLSLTELVHIKESAERLLGIHTSGFRLYMVNKIYANHIGDYRLLSVFPGAKLRNGVKMVDIAEFKNRIQ